MTSKYRNRPRDTARMLWVKSLPCCAYTGPWPAMLIWPCEGVVEADHAGGGSGMGRKADDSTVIPLCQRHHRSPGLEHLVYGHVPHGTVRRWKAERAEHYRKLYDERKQ
jgi:hypothetical protein